MLGLTRQERGIVAFLIAGLVLGSLVTIYKRQLRPPVLPEVDERTVAAFDSISQRLAEVDHQQAAAKASSPVSADPTVNGERRSRSVSDPQLAPNSIDINSAGVEDLVRLPGIGPVMATRIVAYRQQHGVFARLEDLRNVKGIGPKVLEKILPFVTLGPKP